MKQKRIAALLTAACLLSCGCQKISKTDPSYAQDPNPASSDGSIVPVGEDALTTLAKVKEITLPSELEGHGFSNFLKTPDGITCMNTGYNNELHLYQFTDDFSDYTETIFVPPASYDGYYYEGGLTASGGDVYYSLAVMENHSNMEPYSDGDDSYDWDLYHETWESDYYLCTYAADGTLADKVQVEGLEAYRSLQGYDQFSDLFCDAESIFLTLSNGAILRIGTDGTLTEVCPAEDEYAYGWTQFLRDRDGKPICYVHKEDTDPNGFVTEVITLSDFDTKTGKVSDPFYTANASMMSMNSGVSVGYGDYRMLHSSEDALYGIRDDGTAEVLIDWEASNLHSMNVMPLEDGSFIGTEYDYDGRLAIYHVTRLRSSELVQKKEIVLGVLGDSVDKDFVTKFNSTHDDYKITITYYKNSDGSYFGDPEGKNDALDELKLAVVSNDAPDLILMDKHHDVFQKLGSRGVFHDLSEFIESDDEYNRNTILPNVLEALRHTNGALYAMPSGFAVSSIAVKSRFCTIENWTVQDMIDLYDNATSAQYQWLSKEDALELLLTGTDFTDEINGTCSFDSPEFIQILEFCNRYPDSLDRPEKNYDDPDAMAKLNKWYMDQYMKYKNDEDYLCPTSFAAMGGFMASPWSYTRYSDLGEDFTLVGYPSDNGVGGRLFTGTEIAILSTCEEKAAAWEFVKEFLRSYSTYYGDHNYFSILNEKFEEQMDDYMYIFDNRERSNEEYYDDDSRVYPMTQEERDDLERYIRSCNTLMILDESVKNIIFEEAGMYFSGDRSAEDSAKMIQSRASLLLSEQS